MALTHSEPREIGTPAPQFALPATDGKIYRLDDFNDRAALVVIFMCNHCPYVIAVQDRINQIAQDYAGRGVALIGINSNDATRYPADGFEEMKKRAKERSFAFPYLFDETQEIARAYNAVCTPDPYVYERQGDQFLLRYHGRIDDNWKDESSVKRRDLREALDAILAAKPVNPDQIPSMGCSIKWKEASGS